MNRAELKQLSKSQLKGNWKVPVLLTLIYLVGISIISIMQNNFDSSLGMFVVFLISIALEVWAFVGLSKFFLKFIEKDGKASFEDVLVSKGALLKSLGFIILISIIGAIVGAIIGVVLVGSILSATMSYISIGSLGWGFWIITILLTAITTVISLALSMTSYILIEKESLGLFEAMGLSIKMMKGHKWELFVIQLSFIGWAILCLLTLGIGYLWLSPYITLTITNFYKELEK